MQADGCACAGPGQPLRCGNHQQRGRLSAAREAAQAGAGARGQARCACAVHRPGCHERAPRGQSQDRRMCSGLQHGCQACLQLYERTAARGRTQDAGQPRQIWQLADLGPWCAGAEPAAQETPAVRRAAPPQRPRRKAASAGQAARHALEAQVGSPWLAADFRVLRQAGWKSCVQAGSQPTKASAHDAAPCT